MRVDDPEKGYTVAPKKGHGRLGLKGVKKRILDLVEDVPDVLPYIKVNVFACIIVISAIDPSPDLSLGYHSFVQPNRLHQKRPSLSVVFFSANHYNDIAAVAVVSFLSVTQPMPCIQFVDKVPI